MTTTTQRPPGSPASAGRTAAHTVAGRLSTYLYRRPVLFLMLLLAPPLLWMLVVYLGSLFMLLLQSFFRLNGFTGQVERQFTLVNYLELLSQANLDIFFRTASMAAAVTIAAAVIAFPLAYFMAHYASGRTRALLYLAVLMPLWSSYIIRVYSWRLILAREGILSWFINLLGLDGLLAAVLRLPVVGGPSLTVSFLGMFVVFVYIWLPYMILPINAALERVPRSVLEASGDLGGRPAQTLRHVTLPLALPGIVAGSIFTFSLTLGDFIVPTTLGNSAFFIGQAVLSHQGTSGNIPLAAAITVVPILIMTV